MLADIRSLLPAVVTISWTFLLDSSPVSPVRAANSSGLAFVRRQSG